MNRYMTLFKQKLSKSISTIKIGNPLDANNHVGPLIDKDAVKMYLSAIEQCKAQGWELCCGALCLMAWVMKAVVM